jgi:anhydro-N-acetylmuramic acid kinase
MVYNVIGLMSGSSLDGLDICFAQLDETRGKWSAQILNAACYPYSSDWTDKLRNASASSVPEFLRLHTAYGRYTADLVNRFIEQNELQHKVHFVASHGHTVFHEPKNQTTFQLGDGASIAAVLGLPVISDLRSLDVALGGQGAPIVPIGDSLLFNDYDLLLNIGGIANISIRKEDNTYTAFDICVANQALNFLAQKLGKEYDESGKIAASGKLIENEFESLASEEYYQRLAPKSLSNELAMSMVKNFLENEVYSIEDRMHTMVHFIADRIYQSILQHLPIENILNPKLLATGGGAFNTYLMQVLSDKLVQNGIGLTIPDAQIVAFKEALVMALIGTLRWREEANVMAQQTGASKASVGGAFWIGA